MNKLFTAISGVFILLSSCSIWQNQNDISIDKFQKKIATERYLLVDVRTAEEFADGYIKGAINIDYLAENFYVEIQELDLETPVLLYCRSGNRSGKAMQIMYDLGFTEVKNLIGGIKGWKAENHKLIK